MSLRKCKPRVITGQVCADCGDIEPGWASVNRGVFICDECCSVHRTLGRHISQTKSLHHSYWNVYLQTMVVNLVNSGANSIWEHCLLDPSQARVGRRKPAPKDAVEPTKSEFIRAKYVDMKFSHRLREEFNNTEKDLSKQLHSSVRTSSVDTCLRLLSLGASVDYMHPKKGTCPIHVAAKSGQSLQVELLVVYGADPGKLDVQGQSAEDYALSSGFVELAERLVELQYTLTDTLTFYLCSKLPDHRDGQHYLIPEMADNSLDLSHYAKEARSKLEALNNDLFGALTADVYDEVDRRQLDAVWIDLHNPGVTLINNVTVPFLPVNPDLSATRNQGRQKLARFNNREFSTLVIDILKDAKRRQHVNTGFESECTQLQTLNSVKRTPTTPTTEEHDYSNVFKSSIKSSESSVSLRTAPVKPTCSKKPSCSTDDEDDDHVYDTVPLDNALLFDNQETDLNSPITMRQYVDIKQMLKLSASRVNHLEQMNCNLQSEIHTMQNMVQQLMVENSELRGPSGGPSSDPTLKQANSIECNRPISLAGISPWQSEIDSKHSLSSVSKLSSRVSQSGSSSSMEDHLSQIYEEKIETLEGVSWEEGCDYDIPKSSVVPVTDSPRCHETDVLKGDELGSIDVSVDRSSWPDSVLVVKATERITRYIQVLLSATKTNDLHSLPALAENIFSSVEEMVGLFPQKEHGYNGVTESLELMTTSAERLQTHTYNLLQCKTTAGIDEEDDPTIRGRTEINSLDPGTKHNLTQLLIECYINIANGAKQIVTKFQ